MDPNKSLNPQLREEAVKEVLKDQAIRGRKLGPMEFIQNVAKKFIQMQIDDFPNLCQIARMQNKLKQDELRKEGKKGLYTDSYGWSDKRTFKHDYEIPQELYLFMMNLVYADFWAEDNEKVWRKFMYRVCRGDDPNELLIWAKKIYGSNSQIKGVTTAGDLI